MTLPKRHQIDNVAFAPRFARARAQNNLTFRDVAEKVGVAWQSVSGWEHGSLPHARIRQKVADAVSLTFEELYWGEKPDKLRVETNADDRTDVDRLLDAFSKCSRRDQALLVYLAAHLAG